MYLSDMNSNQSYSKKKAASDHVREKADENNDDIEQQHKKNTNNSNIKIVKIELKLMCNHVVACAHTQGPISHLSYSKRKKQNAEKIVNRRA